jgi:hypothetical protein
MKRWRQDKNNLTAHASTALVSQKISTCLLNFREWEPIAVKVIIVASTAAMPPWIVLLHTETLWVVVIWPVILLLQLLLSALKVIKQF